MIIFAFNGMTEFMIIAAVVAIIIYGLSRLNSNKDSIAIKLRKDGTPEYQRVSNTGGEEFPLLLKIVIFVMIASVLFIPLDFILNRS